MHQRHPMKSDLTPATPTGSRPVPRKTSRTPERLGFGEYASVRRDYSDWAPSPVVAHARSLFFAELDQPDLADWKARGVLGELMTFRHSLAPRTVLIPSGRQHTRDVYDATVDWASTRRLGAWFAHLALFANWSGPTSDLLMEQLEEVRRGEGIVARINPYGMQSRHSCDALVKTMTLRVDATVETEPQAIAVATQLVRLAFRDFGTALDAGALPGMQRTGRLVKGSVRSTSARYRWLAQHYCFQVPLSRVGRGAENDVARAVHQAADEVGLQL